MEIIFLSFFTSFTIVLLSMPALIKIALLKRLTDAPDEDRKLHKKTVPSLGGILIFAGTLFTYFIWYPFKNITDYQHLISAIVDFKYIGASMLILFFIGVKDDIIGTAAVKKLMGHLLVAFILVMMANIRITSLHGLFGIFELNEWASVGLSIFTYTVIVNALNLIDGVDGLAGGVGVIACSVYGLWFFEAGGLENTCLAFSLAGALVGFLFFNFSNAKIFMGDSGSLIIGLIISILSIKLIEFDKSELPAGLMRISKPVLAMAAIVYPLIDTLRIFIYRAVRGISPFSPDRNHIHHRLQDIGLSDKQVTLTIYLYSATIVSIPLLLTNFEPSIQLAITGGTALILMQIPFFFKKVKNKKMVAIKSENSSPKTKVS